MHSDLCEIKLICHNEFKLSNPIQMCLIYFSNDEVKVLEYKILYCVYIPYKIENRPEKL